MKAAVLSIDITPPLGLPLGGNVRNDNLARGVHDNLFCNVVLLEDEGRKVCFLGFDFLGLHYETCQYIKNEIEKKTGISSKKIIISTTHTHSGPDVVDFFKPELDSSCMKYVEDITPKIAEGIKNLKNQLEEVDISVAKKLVCDLSFNRRLIMKNGDMKMNWEGVDVDSVDKEAGPIDPDLSVISITDAEGKLKAVMVNFTLHPAVLVGKDWLWSRDYINYLDIYLKDKLGKDVVIFFANGAEGNINHLNFRDSMQDRGFDEAKRIGETLGKYVLEAMESSQVIKDINLKCVSATIKLPFRPISINDRENAEKLLKEKGDTIPSMLDGVPDEIYAREIVKLSRIQEKFATTEIQAVKLGDTVIATLPGEVFVEFGLEIKRISDYNNTILFGLSNDCIGYIPTQVSFKEGGYEIKTASSSKLDIMAGDMLVTEVSQIIKSL